MNDVIERPCDMGSGLKLALLKEDDGDVIVQIMPQAHRFSEQAVEICASGTQSPKTHAALLALFKAMEQDAESRPLIGAAEANVERLHPARNLENLPHMLRVWADNFEQGVMGSPTTVLTICLSPNRNERPTVYMAGESRSVHELIGVFTAAANAQLQYL